MMAIERVPIIWYYFWNTTCSGSDNLLFSGDHALKSVHRDVHNTLKIPVVEQHRTGSVPDCWILDKLRQTSASCDLLWDSFNRRRQFCGVHLILYNYICLTKDETVFATYVWRQNASGGSDKATCSTRNICAYSICRWGTSKLDRHKETKEPQHRLQRYINCTVQNAHRCHKQTPLCNNKDLQSWTSQQTALYFARRTYSVT